MTDRETECTDSIKTQSSRETLKRLTQHEGNYQMEQWGFISSQSHYPKIFPLGIACKPLVKKLNHNREIPRVYLFHSIKTSCELFMRSASALWIYFSFSASYGVYHFTIFHCPSISFSNSHRCMHFLFSRYSMPDATFSAILINILGFKLWPSVRKKVRKSPPVRRIHHQETCFVAWTF